MKVLIDTNVILDVLQNRHMYVKSASIVWKLCEVGKIEGVIHSLSFANLVYVMRKELDPQTIEKVYKSMSAIFTFADLKGSDLEQAASMQWNDFEDALHCVAAKRIKADYIVTRNKRDFNNCGVPTCTPDALISLLS